MQMSVSPRALYTVLIGAASTVVGQQFEYIEISGTGIGQAHNQELFEQAAAEPLVVASLPFTGFDLGAEPGTISSASRPWSWNLNLTNVRVDDASIGGDAEVTTIVHDIDLDVPELLPAADSGWQVCASIWDGEFTAGFQPFNDNVQGSCALVLGQECFEAWSSAFDSPSGPGDCLPPPDFSTISQCGNLSGIDTQWISLSLVEYSDDDGTPRGLRDRQGFYFQSTSAHPCADTARVTKEQAAKVRMMVLNQRPADNDEETSAAITSYLCQSFKPRDFEEFGGIDDEDNGEERSSSGEETSSNDGHRLSSTSIIGAVLLVVALLTGLL